MLYSVVTLDEQIYFVPILFDTYLLPNIFSCLVSRSWSSNLLRLSNGFRSPWWSGIGGILSTSGRRPLGRAAAMVSPLGRAAAAMVRCMQCAAARLCGIELEGLNSNIERLHDDTLSRDSLQWLYATIPWSLFTALYSLHSGWSRVGENIMHKRITGGKVLNTARCFSRTFIEENIYSQFP